MLNLVRGTGGEERMRVKEHAKNTGIILYLRCRRGLAERQEGPRVTWCQALSFRKVLIKRAPKLKLLHCLTIKEK